jgi:Na+/H+-translocating membrane pyrophosphatase
VIRINVGDNVRRRRQSYGADLFETYAVTVVYARTDAARAGLHDAGRYRIVNEPCSTPSCLGAVLDRRLAIVGTFFVTCA